MLMTKKSMLVGVLISAAMCGTPVSAYGEEAGEAKPKGRPANPVDEASHLSSYFQANTLRKMTSVTATNWIEEGPYGLGRFSDVQIDPTNDQILYAGSATGGIFKTTNGGTSYTQIFNDYDQSIGAIAVDPNNPQIIWAGGGENMYGGGSHTYPGTGIFKSTDAGLTWKKMGLDSSFYIARISVTPGNSNQIFAAVQGSLWGKSTYRGVYRSQNGGTTWQQVL